MSLLIEWLPTVLVIANLSIFVYAGHAYYIGKLDLRSFHGFKALFYFLLVLGTKLAGPKIPPPPLLMQALILFFLRDLYIYLEPLKKNYP